MASHPFHQLHIEQQKEDEDHQNSKSCTNAQHQRPIGFVKRKGLIDYLAALRQLVKGNPKMPKLVIVIHNPHCAVRNDRQLIGAFPLQNTQCQFR
ncbi:hypothetical protein D3C73_1347460 [compost metagenome]